MYFARLLERYGPPVYPIAIFSRRSRRPREGRYHLRFHDLDISDFRYLTFRCRRRHAIARLPEMDQPTIPDL